MKSLKLLWQWLDDRSCLSKLLGPLLGHPVPPGARWQYVFGSALLAVFVLQVVTGITLATTYIPSTGEAYQSLQFITHGSSVGALLRGMHDWGAAAMVVLLGLHLLRVLLTGSYKFPRELNWISGVGLLGLTLALAFTGQILRWDQNAVWSLVVGAEQAGRVPVIGTWLARFIIGGQVLGGDTLSRIFAVHVFVLPLLLAALAGLHLQLVLRHGISEPPVRGRPVDPATYRAEYAAMLDREGVPFWPWAVWRDAVFAVAVMLAVVVLAATVGAPALDRPPDPSLVRSLPRPDWYFWWYFALLALLPHALENYVMLLAPLMIGAGLLALPLLSSRGERHPARRPMALAMVVLALAIIGALTYAGWREDWSPRFDAAPLTAEEIGATAGPVFRGGMLFNSRGCLYCHAIEGHGGFRGPDLTRIGDRLTRDQMTLRILNGAYNMPVFAGILTADQTHDLVAFLASRRTPGSAVGEREKNQ